MIGDERMTTKSPLSAVTPSLSIQLVTFAAHDPGGWQPLLDRARAADRAGIDRVVVSDHVVFGENLAAYGRPELGGIDGAEQPTGPDGHWLEPMTVLGVLAGTTSTVRLGTGVLLAALRRPAVLAKSAATLDVLSGGRLDLGVGIGWQREEYEAAGLEFSARGRLLDETLAVCQTLWRDTPASFTSETLHFEGVHAMPKPVQPGGVPIWVSGTLNARMLDRLVRFGSGWIPWGRYIADPASGISRAREALSAGGRDPATLQVQGSLGIVKRPDGTVDLAQTMAAVPSLVATGITDFRVSLRLPPDVEAATEQLTELVTAFRPAAGRERATPR